MNPATELPQRARKAAASGARPETKSGRTPCHTLDHQGDGTVDDCDTCGGYGVISWDVEDVGTDSIPCPRGCEDKTW